MEDSEDRLYLSAESWKWLNFALKKLSLAWHGTIFKGPVLEETPYKALEFLADKFNLNPESGHLRAVGKWMRHSLVVDICEDIFKFDHEPGLPVLWTYTKFAAVVAVKLSELSGPQKILPLILDGTEEIPLASMGGFLHDMNTASEELKECLRRWEVPREDSEDLWVALTKLTTFGKSEKTEGKKISTIHPIACGALVMPIVAFAAMDEEDRPTLDEVCSALKVCFEHSYAQDFPNFNTESLKKILVRVKRHTDDWEERQILSRMEPITVTNTEISGREFKEFFQKSVLAGLADPTEEEKETRKKAFAEKP